MTRSMAQIVRFSESQSIAKVLFWCSMALTFLCEVAAITIMAAISTNNVQSDSEVWAAVWFFAVNGGIIWIVGRVGEFLSVPATASRSGGNDKNHRLKVGL